MAKKRWRKSGAERGFTVQRFKEWFAGRPRPIHILFLFMFLLLGAAATTTVRSHNSDPLASLGEDQLVTLLSDLQAREDDLRGERRQLQDELQELTDAVDAKQAAQEAAERSMWRAEVASGVSPVSGPGIIIEASAPTQPYPVSVFVTTLAELRNAGAEAIELNGVRLTGRSWFGSGGEVGVVVDDETVVPPYVWRAIGDPDTLAMGVEIRGGAVSQLRAYGSGVSVEKLVSVNIDSVATVPEPQWASFSDN